MRGWSIQLVAFFVVVASLASGQVGNGTAYLFLMQERFSTGQTLVVDGGTVLV